MKSFKLSFKGKLSCTLSIALITGAGTAVAETNNTSIFFMSGMAAIPAQANEPIVAGGNSAPSVSSADNGATVINIVKPNEQGLSHNTYDKYNVNTAGAVLNNATQDGQSQLAGQVQANKNITDQAAKVILNEVVSRNPSLLLGQQEVFGMAADYVLANPNGITCDGCGFINIPRASMVVGEAEISEGQIKTLNSSRNNNSLTIQGKGVSGSEVLDLVAPKINASASIKATKEINAASGHNKMDYQSKQVTGIHSQQQNLDGYYVGGMQAGRINIVSTGQGNGVNLSGEIQTTTEAGLDLKGHGVINLVSAKIKGNVNTNAKDLVLTGKVEDNHQVQQLDGNYSAYNGASKKQRSTEDQQWNQTEIQGDVIHLNATNKVEINAAKLRGKDIQVLSKNIDLNSQKLKDKTEHIDHNWHYSWEHNQTQTTENERQIGNDFRGENVKIKATEGNVEITASAVHADQNLSVSADRGKVLLDGAVQKSRSMNVGNKRNHTANLETGSWNEANESETLKKTWLTANHNLGITGKSGVSISGADVWADGDMLITSESGKVEVGTQQISNNKVTRSDQVYWGGIGGGHNTDNNRSDKLQVASDVKAKGIVLLNGEQGVNIQGSKVQAQKGGYAQSGTGSVTVDHATNFSHEIINQRNGTVFNITKNALSSDEQRENAQSAELLSDATFNVIAKQDINVVGSIINVAEQLNLTSVGNINIEGAKQALNKTTKTNEVKATAYAREDGDKQYRAGVGIELSSSKETLAQVTHLGSVVQGGSLNLTTDSDVNIKGSSLKTSQGNATVNAENIHITAQQDQKNLQTDSGKSGFGVYVGGGMDRVTIGLESGMTKVHADKTSETALQSSTEVNGDLTLNAKNSLQYEGGKHQVSGKLQENADNIIRNVSTNSEKEQRETTTVNVEVGASADISGVTRAVEKAVNGLAEGNPVGAFGSVSAIGAPNANTALKLGGGKKVENNESSTALGTQIQAANINATANDVRDVATHYQATDSVMINTQHYANVAAANTEVRKTIEDKGEGSLGVSTSTGLDISVSAKGKGSHSESNSLSSEAVIGGFDTVGDITINAKDGILLEGNTLKSEKGTLALSSQGNIELVQANNIKQSDKNGFNLDISASGGTSPSSKSGSGGIGGGANNSSAQAITAKAGEIAVQHANLTAKNVVLQGVNGKVDSLKVQAGESAVIKAAQGSSSEKGIDWSLNIGVGGNSSGGDKASTGGSFKLGVNIKNTDQAAINYTATTLNADKATIHAGANSDHAVHITGSTIQADELEVNANHGGIVVESLQNAEHKNNWGFGVNANANIKKVSSEEKTTQDGSGNLTVNIDKTAKTTQVLSHLEGKNVRLGSEKDLALLGATVKGNIVNGDIGNNLTIESRKDAEESVGFNLGLNLTNSQNGGALTGVMKVVPSTKKTDELKGKVTTAVNNAAESAGFAEHNPLTGKTLKPSTFNVSGNIVSQDEVTTIAGIQSGEVNLNVKNHIQLNGASITSTDSRPNVNTVSVGVENIAGHHNRYQGELDVSNNIPLLIQEAVKDLKDAKFPLINGSVKKDSSNVVSEIDQVIKR
ncbi:hemagglutinin repeat-containing protein [Testudinibacter sp. TR-2022]|uniref:hemagglutinin repeat-containing protein n=2 Tax=Testudinibacter sp. TR-2022 TaxID=2585029 RepID=UPI00111A282F|nr:hemagglutinin repeat-containing protein [Testudinibacter sp. TR-2022]TNH05395.1 filamentous hemagglutinin N-terminal domain-containing protein [Pasteurellaceae bacterium Phil11]TNH27853.1 filamentous hemagglutinin N-terminal domain-containing protein [Testudinibacter sp. TR-2022]